MADKAQKRRSPFDDTLSKEDQADIRDSIFEKYRQVAGSPEGLFAYPIGEKGLHASGYDPEWIRAIPLSVRSFYCGVGNPFRIAPISFGESIIDIGCGAGVDTLIAGFLTGEKGVAVGVDITPSMIRRANSNLELTGMGNVRFQVIDSDTDTQPLPFKDRSFNKVISNGVFNLIPDKKAMLDEAYRLLKPGGYLMIADQIMTSSVKKPLKERVKSWFQ